MFRSIAPWEMTTLALTMAKAAAPLPSGFEALDALVKSAGMGLWQVDLSSKFVWWSAKTREIHGVGPSEPVDLLTALAFCKPDDRAALCAAVKQAANGDELAINMHHIITRRNGREIELHSTAVCLSENGKPRWLLGCCAEVRGGTAADNEDERLALAVRQMGSAAIVTDDQSRITWVNQAFVDNTGYSLEEARGRTPGDLLQGRDSDGEMQAAVALALKGGGSIRRELLYHKRDGSPYWVDLTATPLRDGEGNIIGGVSVQIDCSERREAQQAARHELEAKRRTEILLRDILDAVPAYVFAFDDQDRLLLVSNMVREHFPTFGAQLRPGLAMDDVMRLWLSERGVQTLTGEQGSAELVAERSNLIRQGMKANERRLADGRWLLSSTQRSSSGNLIWAKTDITALKTSQLAAAELARRDPLTGLLNRKAFMARLQALRQAIAPAEIPRRGCMVVIDIDHFKAVNDAYGHHAGDTLLKTIAERMEAASRPSDLLARLGGDEFALFIEVDSEAEAHQRANGLLAACMAEVVFEGFHLLPSVSIGAAMPATAVLDCETLLRNADRALFAAKRSGRGSVAFYSGALAHELSEKHELAQELRTALNNDELTIALQPQYDLRSGKIVAFEALARWETGGRSVEPLKFVAVAEEHGLAHQLGIRVLTKALNASRRIQDEAGAVLRMGVNISNAQILSDDFEESIKAVLDQVGLPPDILELEVTETVFLQRSWDQISDRLTRLRNLGIRLALDDFGTGHASLSHLGQLIIDAVKMDRSFVDALGRDKRRELIARTIATLAAGLEIECVAEGIETEQQLEALSRFGCTTGQGYLLGYPMSVDEAIALVKSQAEGLNDAIGRGVVPQTLPDQP